MSTAATVAPDGSFPPIPHLTVEERSARGKSARAAVPRSSHSTWAPEATRPDPVALLQSQEASRVPALIDLRHQRMLASPFAFYRGAAIVMASDLSMTPSSGLRVQACGDAHLANFGGFASPDRRLVFDINDFDETTPGPFEWDVKRLAASFEIAARSREFSAKLAREATLRAASAYREAMAEFAGMTNLETWYARLDVDAILQRWQADLSDKELKRLSNLTSKAETKDSTKALGKLAQMVDGEYRIKHDPPLVVPIEELASEEGIDVAPEEIRAWLADRFRIYRQSLQPDRRHLLEDYRLVDFARKVVGVGSVGTRCWIGLMMGKDDADPLFLQIKEAQPSVLEPFTGASEYSHHGQRVVEGQRLLQTSSDILLGWVRTDGVDGVQRDFYARQLWDWKMSADLEAISPMFLKIYAEMCGWTLARGHARSGDRVALSAYLGSSDVFDRAIADFASAYADQNQRDYEHAVATISGRSPSPPVPQPA